MRRKCFYLLIAVLFVLYLLDFAGVPLRSGMDESLFACEMSFTGKVVSLQEKEDFLRLTVELERVDGRVVKPHERVLLSFYGDTEKPWELLNRRIVFSTQLAHPQGKRNPHCFDYAKYLKSRKIGAIASVNTLEPTETQLTAKEKYERWLLEKKWLFKEELSQETRGIIMGVLFGDTSFLDEDAYDRFRSSGTTHILAVSGLHVGIIYGIYKRLAGKKNSPAALVILAFVLCTYGELASWSPSVCRAELMIAMSTAAKVFDLRYDMLTAMSAAALVLTAWNPYVIFGAGFQMSFLAICSIAFLRPMMPRRIPDAAASVLAVYIGLMPYQMYQFNYISLTALIANVPIVYLAGLFVPVAAAAFAVFAATGTAGIIGQLTEAMGKLIFFVNRFTSMDGQGGFDVVSPPLWLALGAGASIFLFSSENMSVLRLRGDKKRIAACFAAVVFFSVSFHAFSYCPVGEADVVFVDVGQGDCVHIRDDRTDVLIDGGGAISYNVGKNILKPYLLKNGAWNLELALATHEHMDHYKGLTELCEEFPVKKLMTGLIAGTTVMLTENVKIQTLWPEEITAEKGQDLNSMCSVFMIYYKEYKILVTGDLDEEGERAMIEKYRGTDMLRADVLKIGHHGSLTSTCEEFLEAVKPYYAVIQCGKNNYGHPAPKTIEKCEEKGIIVYRNDYNGAVGFKFRNSGISCSAVIK